MIKTEENTNPGLTQMDKDKNKLPEGWKWKKLIDCCNRKDQIVSGPFGSNLKVSDYKLKGVPIIRLQNIGDGYFINKCIKYISHEKAKELHYHSYKPGDLVLAKLGIPIGKTCFIPEDFPAGIIVADVVRIRPNKIDIDYSFLKYYLNSDLSVYQLVDNISGATRPRVNLNHVRDIQIPLPSLPEQKRIVAILDEAFAAIDKAKANAEKNFANAKELFDSYLNSIFANPGKDWEEKKLGEITHKIGSGATPMGGKKSYKDHGISLIRSLNVHDDEFKYNNLAFIDESQANKLSNVTVESKDVLLNITGASIARCNIVPDDTLPARVNQHVSIIRLKQDTVLPEFLHFMLIAKPHKEKLLFTGDKNGATRQALTKTLIENYHIKYPDFKEQEYIIKKIKSVKTESIHLKEISEKKITALDELKKSILKKAFEGEL